MTSTVQSEPVEGPEPASGLEGVVVAVGVGESVAGDCVAVAVGVAVCESVVVSLVDIVVVEGDGGREVVVLVGVELAVTVGLGVVVALSAVVEDEVAVVSPVPVEPPQPARVTMRTSPSTESKRRIDSTLIAASY